jgi:hypothetical protein
LCEFVKLEIGMQAQLNSTLVLFLKPAFGLTHVYSQAGFLNKTSFTVFANVSHV